MRWHPHSGLAAPGIRPRAVRKTFQRSDLLYECKDVMASKAEEDKIQCGWKRLTLALLEATAISSSSNSNLVSNAIKYNRQMDL